MEGTIRKVLPRLSWSSDVSWFLPDDKSMTIANAGIVKCQTEIAERFQHCHRVVTFKNDVDIVIYVEYATHLRDNLLYKLTANEPVKC